MATKKKEPGTAVMNWDEELAKDADLQSKASTKGAGGKFFSFQGGQMKFQGDAIPGNEVNLIVTDFIYENAFYEGNYDPDNKSAPVCYAFDRDEETLAPFKDCEDIQNAVCDGCPQNQFGSAPIGKGKACKNVVRLAVLPEDALDDLSALDSYELAYVKVPVTSKKHWDSYYKKACRGVAGNKPSFFYITRMKLEPDAKTQIKVSFEAVESLETRKDGLKEYAALKAKVAVTREDIMFKYPRNADLAEAKKAAPAKANKFSRKK